jgi:asparagine N-glycosylation enzyme membrane subunit Stt3
VTLNPRWLPLALAVVGWHSLLAELSAAARVQPALRWPALLLAFALPAAGAVILLRGPDLATHSGRRLRLWAHLATLAPVIATVLRVPQSLPTGPVWLALFGAPLAVSLWRGLREDDAVMPAAVAVPPSSIALKLHRWSAAVTLVIAMALCGIHLRNDRRAASRPFRVSLKQARRRGSALSPSAP